MKSKVKENKRCRCQVVVEFSPDETRTEYEDFVKEYCRRAQIRGFRRGKAPRRIVEQKFRRQIVEDAVESLVSKGLRAAVDQHSLKVVVVRKVERGAFDGPKGFTFEALLETEPEFKLPEYRGIKVKVDKSAVSVEGIDDVIADLRRSSAVFREDPERHVQTGDVVVVELDGSCDGKPLKSVAGSAGAWAGDGRLTIEVGNEYLPRGLSAGLIGARKGDRRDISVEFPEDFHQSELAGRRVEYSAAVISVKTMDEKATDQKICSSMGMADMEAVSAKIREDLERRQEAQLREKIRSEVVAYLLAHTRLNDLPASEVADESSGLLRDMLLEQAFSGVSKDEMEKRGDEFRRKAVAGAQDRIKLRYILHRIAEEEDIHESNEEVSRVLIGMAVRQGVKPDIFVRRMSKSGRLRDVAEQVRLSKALDFVVANASVEQ